MRITYTIGHGYPRATWTGELPRHPAENHAKSGSLGRRHGACMMLMNYEAHACLSLQKPVASAPCITLPQ